jgi:hypothetical protein
MLRFDLRHPTATVGKQSRHRFRDSTVSHFLLVPLACRSIALFSRPETGTLIGLAETMPLLTFP